MTTQIDEFLQQRVDAGDFPSAAYLAAERGDVILSGAAGNAVVEPEVIPAAMSTIYDLASLTKPLVTGLLLAKLIEAREVQIDARVAIYLPEFETEGKRMITVRDLVTHTSRLPSWLPHYIVCEGADDVLRTIANTPLDMTQAPVTYSDLGFIALGKIVERFMGAPLAESGREHILRPLGLADSYFSPPGELRGRIAASERGNAYERQTCIDRGFVIPEPPPGPLARESVIWGEVHDGNAYFMGGMAGHAGLFATAADTFAIAMQFLAGHSTVLRPATCELFTTNYTPGMNEDRSFAFQLASTEGSAAGGTISRRSFGHLGFTGTSVFIDPDAERVFILLTNRTHAHSLPFVNINSVRRRFHDLAAAALDRN
jgi:CubicO group peptidase (beta-lactamase class C family)